MLKKTFAVIGTLALALTLASCGAKSDEQLMEEGWVKNPAEHGWVKDPATNGWVEAPKALPAAPAEFGNAHATINGKNLGSFMNRTDVAYIDLRGVDEGYQSGHIKGFEPVSFFKLICGDGQQLFTKTFEPRYNESVALLKGYFPQDKALFLMCQGGARVETMMALLKHHKYDMSKVYNVSGYKQLKEKTSTVHDLVVIGTANPSGVNYFPTYIDKDGKEKLVGLTPITK